MILSVQLKSLLVIVYTASVLSSAFCPMQMVSAMPMPAEPQEQTEAVAMMTPVVLMSMAVPMSMAAEHSSEATPKPSNPGSCSGGNCFAMAHRTEQDGSFVSSSTERTGAALPTAIAAPSWLGVFTLLELPGANSVHVRKTIATVVLRV